MIDVLVYRIITSYSGTWSGFTLTADNYIHVQIDPATFAIEVWYTSAEVQDAGTIYGQLFTGPNLYFGDDGLSTLTINNNWQACDGTVLRKIGTNNLFPYATLSYNEGAAECAIVPVCDLNISVGIITDATGPANSDGSFTVVGTSSNGTIKYSLTSTFDYATEGQTSDTFSGLLPGSYTVYAKDGAGCTDSVGVTIPITTQYGVRLRLTFQDNPVYQDHRIDILVRAYEGEIEDFCSDAEVAKIKYKYSDTNDPDISAVPSYMDLALMVEEEGQYSYLYGSDSDDRKFKVQYYLNDELYWTGFIVVEFYNGPYLHVPYPIQITATDGLEELTQDFADASGNQFKEPITMIKAISEVLKSTDLNLPIRNGIELWDSGMDEGVDLLQQNYFDPDIIIDKKGLEAVQSLIEPFRARVYQSKGVWWITRNSDNVGTFHFTEYDKDGVEQDDDDFNPVVDLNVPSVSNCMKWRERSQRQEFIRNYGYIAVNNILGKDGNLIDSGRFEAEDVVELGSGNFGFKDWNIAIGQPGVKYGFEKLLNSSGPNGSSKGCAFFDFETVVSDQGAYNAQNYTKIYSKRIPFTRNGMMKVKFDYKAIRRYNVPWVRLAWSVETNPGPTAIGSGSVPAWFTPLFPPFFSFAQADPIINEIAIDNFNSWQHFELIGRTGYGGVDNDGYIEVTFYMHNHYGRDFDDITALKAYDLEGEPFAPGQVGKKVMVAEDNLLYLYTSEISTDAESLPDVVRPITYGAGQVLWRLDKILSINTLVPEQKNTGLVNKFNLDNVGIEFYYFTADNSVVTDPPEELLYDQEINAFNKSDLVQTILFGDMIRFNEEFELNEREVYDGWFRLADGTPTELWHREGVDEEKRLLTILKEDLVSQFTSSRERLVGLLIGDVPLHYVNAIRNVPGDNARYIHTDFQLDIKRLRYSVNLIEVLTGEGGEPPVLTGEFNDDFSDDFDIGE